VKEILKKIEKNKIAVVANEKMVIGFQLKKRNERLLKRKMNSWKRKMDLWSRKIDLSSRNAYLQPIDVK